MALYLEKLLGDAASCELSPSSDHHDRFDNQSVTLRCDKSYSSSKLLWTLPHPADLLQEREGDPPIGAGMAARRAAAISSSSHSHMLRGSLGFCLPPLRCRPFVTHRVVLARRIQLQPGTACEQFPLTRRAKQTVDRNRLQIKRKGL